MKKIIISASLLLLVSNFVHAQKKDKFLWGVATAAYQVEGAYQADNKGESKWDLLANKIGITQFLIGKKETGNVAINMYDRTQYLKDIQLMKMLGINSFRLSLNWSRIIPDGNGAVNEKGLAHYDLLIDDLLAAGIEPIVTLYHFDYPVALLQRGGWGNPEMIDWYTNYASIVLKRYGKKVKKFITFNEPYIEFFIADFLENIEQSKEPANVRYAKGMIKAHHELLANAAVIKLYHSLNLGGQIGITLNLSPCLPFGANSAKDIKAVALQDKLLNTTFLDGVFKGTYPQEVIDSIQKYDPSFKPTAAEMATLASQKPDFLGVNFYAPAFVKYDESSPMSTSWIDNNPDTLAADFGKIRPEYLYKLLMRIKNEYGNPVIMITENGADFKNDDILKGNKVNDVLRVNYIKKHTDAMLKAKADGVNLIGYMVWSGWDNFEWVFGYTKRFGIIYVDMDTQERTPKQSYYEYQKIIKRNKSLLNN